MKQRDIIGRIAHFFLPLSIIICILNALHTININLLILISIITTIIFSTIGYIWEYKLQQFIALKFPKLNWKIKPDKIAMLAVIAGSIAGSLLFFIL